MQINFGVNAGDWREAVDWIIKYLPLLLPLAIIQFGLLLFAVIDIVKKRKTKNLNMIIWVLIVCFANMIGPILYLIFGRSDTGIDDGKNDDDDI